MPKGVKGFQKGHKKFAGAGYQKGQTKAAPSKEQVVEAFKDQGLKMLAALREIALYSDSQTARVAAAKEILDRGFGRTDANPQNGSGAPMVFKMFLNGGALAVGSIERAQLPEPASSAQEDILEIEEYSTADDIDNSAYGSEDLAIAAPFADSALEDEECVDEDEESGVEYSEECANQDYDNPVMDIEDVEKFNADLEEALELERVMREWRQHES